MILQRNTRCGFTLIEALISMVLVGLAIAALMVSNQSFTSANGIGMEMSTAEFLIDQIREQTSMTKFDNLVTKSGSTSVPGYSQKTTVEDVTDPALWKVTIPPTPIPFRRITVEISLNNEPVGSASWLRAKY